MNSKKLIVHSITGAVCLVCLVAVAEPITVKTAMLADVAIYPQRSAPATVISLNDTSVAAQIAARVEAIPVRVGDVVAKGDVLARLDCADYKLATREARARLESLTARIELAKRRLERTRKLTLKQSVSEELLDERESDLAVLTADRLAANADLEQAKLNESRCDVISPFHGLITERISAVGQYVDKGKPLVQILDVDLLEVSAQVFNQDTEQLTDLDDIAFEYAGRHYPIKLRTIVPAINSETRNREVRLLFMDGPALPGAAGKIYWRDRRPHIPGDLLVRRDGQLGIFISNNQQAHFVPMPDAQAGRASPVDLPDETLVIIQGHYALKDNDPISISR